MSLIHGSAGGLGGAGAPGGPLAGGAVFSHTIGQSLRINTADSAYLSRASVSGGSTNKMTFSSWVKRVAPGVYHLLWYAKNASSGRYDAIWIGQDDQIQVILDSTVSGYPQWSAKLRDPSAWYNIVVKFKLDESTSTDRVKLYINGVDQGDAANYPASSATFSAWFVNSQTSYMGFDSGSTYGGGMMADVNVLDGVAAGPSSFGETVGGVWVPVDTSGLTFGANGFRLEFANKGTATTSEGTTATTNIGDDSSGQGHNFAVTNIAAHDVVSDSPTNNFPTFNPLNITGQTLTHSEGNLEVASSSTWSSSIYSRMTMAGIGGGTGKFYAEFCNYGSSGGGSTVIGIGNYESLAGGSDPTTYHNNAVIYYYDYITSNLTRVDIGGNYSSPPGISGNEVLRMAWDCSNGKVWMGGSQEFFDVGSGVGDPANGTNPSGTISSFSGAPIGVLHNRASNAGRCIMNFGQNGTFNGTLTAGGNSDANGIGDFFYPVPSGFVALCASNLPNITIGPGQATQADDHFETILYTGNGGEQHIGAGGAQHPQDTTAIANSVIFNGSDEELTAREPSGAGNQKTWTWSAWVKRSKLGAYQTLFSTNQSSDDATAFNFGFTDGDVLVVSPWSHNFVTTSRKFKDTSKFYHILLKFDTTQTGSNNSDRITIYVDGVEQTLVNGSASLAHDTAYAINQTEEHRIGNWESVNWFFGGYLAEVNFVDGTAYDADTFGQVGTNGYWIPKALSGISYGTNGFRLTFQNSSYLGYDYQTSGRSGTPNDFTPTGLATTDQVIDSPTQNFATMNPNRYSGIGTFSEGNLTVTTSTNNRATYGTIAVPSSGKWYYEVRVDSYASNGGTYMGWGTKVTEGDNEYAADHGISFSSYNEQVLLDNSSQSGGYGATSTNAASNGDVYSVLLDVDNGLFYYAKNGTYFNSANPSNGTGGLSVGSVLGAATTEVRPMLTRGGSYNEAYTFNFGQDPSFNAGETAPGTNKTDANGRGEFLYDVPTGFLALVDDNIPKTGIESPDLVFIKGRTAIQANMFDTVRGPNKAIFPNAATAENTTDKNRLLAFLNQGFTVGDNNVVNQINKTFVSWNWKAGGISPTQTYEVKVVNDSGNKYRFDDNSTNALTLNLQEGGTYTFDQSDSSNGAGGTHPLRFSTTSDGTHGGGSEYTAGVTTSGTPGQAGAKTVITVAHGAPTLYYYCTQHSGMGGQANTTTTHGSSNFKGSIPAIVSANQDAGFSIVKYTGTGSAATLGHGLSNSPNVVIVKNLDDGSKGWPVLHTALTNEYLELNSTNDAFSGSTYFNNTAPTNTVFSVGTVGSTNESGDDFIAYCFHSVEGYSKFGSFAGNSAADGTFVYLGFRPAYIWLKRDSDGVDWSLFDSKRLGYNVDNNNLRAFAASAAAEQTDDDIDLLSNGFKCRRNFANNQGTVLYFAWAEQPFKFANAR